MIIYSKKALARTNYNLNKSKLIIKDNRYYDYYCNISFPFDLLNKIIINSIKSKLNYINNNKDIYIKRIIYEVLDKEALRLFNKKVELNKKIIDLFNAYSNKSITNEYYQSLLNDLNEEIIKYDRLLSLYHYDNNLESNIKLMIDGLPSINDLNISIINDICDYIIYDSDYNNTIIIFKFESKLNIPSLKIYKLVKLEKRKINVKEEIINIIKNNNNFKIKDIVNVLNEECNAYTYSMIKHYIQKLEKENIIKLDGPSRRYACYKLVDNKENNYMNKTCKKIYDLLYDNQYLSYNELSNILNISISSVRTYVLLLRKNGAFNAPHFDKTIIQQGSRSSIFISSKLSDKKEKDIIEYINNHPNISRYKLAKELNISEGTARRLLRECRE